MTESEEIVEYSSQMDFVVAMVKRYLQEDDVPLVHARRVHYWATELPKHLRTIPSSGNRTTVYDNTAYFYDRFLKLLARARIKGLLPWELIWDKKNPPMYKCQSRTEGGGELDFTQLTPYEVPEIEEISMQSWEDLLAEVAVNPQVEHPRFIHQDHYLCIAVEKEAAAQSQLENLCETYGCDLLIFTGNFSVTRVHDAVVEAQERDLPMKIFYFSDLDPAGIDMPIGFMQRLQQMYPREDHKMYRVGLTLDQANEYHLAKNFSTKKISKTQWDRFVKATGSDRVVELDGLLVKHFVAYLEEAIIPHANLEEDGKHYRELVAEFDEKADILNNRIQKHIDEISDETLAGLVEVWEESEEEIEEINNDIANLNERIREVSAKREKLQKEFNDALVKAVTPGYDWVRGDFKVLTIPRSDAISFVAKPDGRFICIVERKGAQYYLWDVLASENDIPDDVYEADILYKDAKLVNPQVLDILRPKINRTMVNPTSRK